MYWCLLWVIIVTSDKYIMNLLYLNNTFSQVLYFSAIIIRVTEYPLTQEIPADTRRIAVMRCSRNENCQNFTSTDLCWMNPASVSPRHLELPRTSSSSCIQIAETNGHLNSISPAEVCLWFANPTPTTIIVIVIIITLIIIDSSYKHLINWRTQECIYCEQKTT